MNKTMLFKKLVIIEPYFFFYWIHSVLYLCLPKILISLFDKNISFCTVKFFLYLYPSYIVLKNVHFGEEKKLTFPTHSPGLSRVKSFYHPAALVGKY